MTKLARAALAGALSIATLGAAATTADAGNYNRWHRHHCYNCGWSPGGALVTGAFVGLGIAALTSPTYYYPPPPPRSYAPRARFVAPSTGNPHIDWCSATYRSYSAESDTWVDYNGVVRPCIGPY
jgi:hypothetical protein